MIKFFRHIRQNMINQNRAKKYFLYALGEIFLVVVGILIALQINNWNEKKANEEKIASTLKQIQLDLLNDIQEASTALEFLEKNLDLADAFLKSTQPKSYFEKNLRTFAQINLSFIPVAQSNQSFLRLKDQINILPEKYNDLIMSLNRLYIENGNFLVESQNIARDQMFAYKTTLYDTYNWIEDYNNYDYSDEIKEFFLDSDINRRQLVKTQAILREHTNLLGTIKTQSVWCYLIIRDALKESTEMPELIADIGINYTKNDVEEYVGQYRFNENSPYEIEFKHNVLILTNTENKNVRLEGFLLKEIGRDSLGIVFPNNRLLKFKRDSLNIIEGFYVINLKTFNEGTYFKKTK